jgi:hypothetical protein
MFQQFDETTEHLVAGRLVIAKEEYKTLW